jgi:predicted acyl esterase
MNRYGRQRHRSLRHPLLLSAFVLFVASAPALHGQRSLAKRAAAVVQTDFYLQTRDGILLDCTRFAPDAPKPKKGWPVMLYCHGYADSKDVELTAARDQAAFGYATYAYSMRGQGKSGGRSHLISRVEMRDLFDVVDAIKRDTLANGERIAVYGSSQGGILPYMAACYGLDVRCILSDLASPIFASDWMANASPKITLFFTVDYDSLTVRYDDEVREIRRLILSKLPADRDSLAALLPRDRDFLDRVDSCRVPLLITNAWQDKFFSANGSIAGAARLRAKNIVYIGAIDGHGADSTAKENRFISTLQNAWIEYWLNGIPHPLLDSVRYQYAASHAPRLGRRWSFTHLSSKVWPPEGIAPAELFFHPDSALADRAPSVPELRTLDNILRDTALTLQQGIDAQFRGPLFTLRYPKQTLSFHGAPLDGDMLMAGIPELRIHYSTTARAFQLDAQIWEVQASGSADLVSRINHSSFHGSPGVALSDTIAGMAHAHIFRKGSRIRVVLTNLDTQPEDAFLLSNPHVLPVLVPGTLTLFMSPQRPSSIVLPMKSFDPVVAAEAPPAPASLRIAGVAPNPFRGSASVTYELPTETRVALLVTDLLGRTVARFDEGQRPAGAHSATLDGSRLAPGLYFATLSTSAGMATTKFLVK